MDENVHGRKNLIYALEGEAGGRDTKEAVP